MCARREAHLGLHASVKDIYVILFKILKARNRLKRLKKNIKHKSKFYKKLINQIIRKINIIRIYKEFLETSSKFHPYKNI